MSDIFRMEEWRRVSEFPAYAVSNLGRMKRLVGYRCLSERIVKTRKGYADIYVEGKLKTIRLARLILTAFIGPPPIVEKKIVARHLNDNDADNRLTNLAWGTQKQNANDAKLNGIKTGHPIGKKLTEEHKRNIGKSLLGHKLSEETKRKIGAANHNSLAGRVPIAVLQQTQCPHCGLKGSMPILKRWHFNNCPKIIDSNVK